MDYRIEQLRFQVREDPSSRHFYQLGELLRREGELEEAVDVLRAGLRHHPGYVAAWVSLGRCLFERRRYEECREAFSRALELDRENAVAATMLGRAAGKCGDWDEAARALSLASSLVPTDAELAEEAEEARRRAHPPVEEEPVAATVEPFQMEEPTDEGAPPAGWGGEDGDTVPTDGGVPLRGAGEIPNDGVEDVPAVAFEDAQTGRQEAMEAGPAPSVSTRTREVVLVSEEDPWAPVLRGDTGVFETGEDVFVPAGFAAASVEEESEPFAVERTTVEEVDGGGAVAWEAEPQALAEEEPISEPEAVVAPGEEAAAVEIAGPMEERETLAESMVPAPAQEELEVADAPSGVVEPPAVVENAATEVEAEPVEELTGGAFEEPADEIPLPTATLARLALEQDDLHLAERTARAVLERDPESLEARRVLEAVAERRLEMRESPAALIARKIERLEAWLGRIRRQSAAGGV